MFWFSDLEKKLEQKLIFFVRTLILNLDSMKLLQTVGNYIRNVIALKRFFKIFGGFWDIWLKKWLLQSEFKTGLPNINIKGDY